MKQVQQVQVALFATIALQRCFSRATLCMVSCALLVVGAMLAWSGIATAQQEPSSVEHSKEDLEAEKLRLEIEKLTNDLSLKDLGRKKAEFEVEKTQLEVTKLRKEASAFSAWLANALTLVLTGIGIGVPYWVARRTRWGALDQSVHERRLEFYPELVNATAPLALHFPPQDSLTPIHCRAVGLSLRTWYFEGGGILLSVKARDAYFKLARALTRASLEPNLAVPVSSTDARYVGTKQVKKYKKILDLGSDHRIGLFRLLTMAIRLLENHNKQNGMEDTWTFGSHTPSGASITEEQRLADQCEEQKLAYQFAYQFKDFVFLQHLSSTLRTKLSEDLRSRRRPAAS